MKKTCEAKGKTREEAIDIALEQLDLTIDEVTIEDIEEGSKGLFGLFGSRPWTVRVTAVKEDKSSEILDTHSLFADSLEEKSSAARQPSEKKEKKAAAPQNTERKTQKTEKNDLPAAENEEPVKQENRQSNTLQPVYKPYLHGTPISTTVIKRSLKIMGLLAVFAFFGALTSGMMGFGSAPVRIAVNAALILFGCFVMLNNGSNQGDRIYPRRSLRQRRRHGRAGQSCLYA